jgi:CRP/FNR family transcriptional regulator, cyclic AMP receptor protein
MEWNPLTVEAIADSAAMRELGEGEGLCRRGEPAHHLTLIVSGTLEISQTSHEGRRHVAGYVGSGEFVNILAVLDGNGALHDATAQTDATVIQIGKSLVMKLLEEDHHFTQTIFQFICKRARQAYDFLAHSHLFSLRQRCAHMLLHLASEFGSFQEDGVHISLKLSQDELAETLGCSRPILNRELKAMEREGLIKVCYSQIVIIDGKKLFELSR